LRFAESLEIGRGVGSPDPEFARKLYRKACDGGLEAACERVGPTGRRRTSPAERSPVTIGSSKPGVAGPIEAYGKLTRSKIQWFVALPGQPVGHQPDSR